MVEALWSTVILLILIGGSGLGMWLQRRLKEHHRSRETTESVRVIAGMVVTFAALVLGLLVTSVKSDFDDHDTIYKQYAIALIEFDQRMVQYGPELEWARALLRTYTASAFALTWPEEQTSPRTGAMSFTHVTEGSDEIAEMSAMVVKLDNGIFSLKPSDAAHASIAGVLQQDVRQLETARWTVIEHTQSKLSPIFLTILVSWLFIVFLIFGIVTPGNTLTAVAIVLSAFAIASSLYLTLDLDTPIGGFIKISSQPFRDAIWHMDHPVRQ